LAPGDVLILDEPFKGLDDCLKSSVMAQVAKHAASTTTIIVTHDKREAQALDARVISWDWS
jgi:ABC-type nitrate/sulfonate/bicarbonate transport system ATPase subunit